MGKHPKPGGGRPHPNASNDGADSEKRNVAGDVHVRGEILIEHTPKETLAREAENDKRTAADRKKRHLEIAGFFVLTVYASLTAVQAYYTARSANAAKSAAKTASTTLENQQRSFEIDQRPYIVADIPQFLNPPYSGHGIQANITFRNIGRTPARRYITGIELLRFDQSNQTQKDLGKFLSTSFAGLAKFISDTQKSGENFDVSDLAPNASVFLTNPLPVIIPTQDTEKAKTGKIALYMLGKVAYTDAFQHPYETNVCYYWVGGQNPKTWHICDAYNTIK